MAIAIPASSAERKPPATPRQRAAEHPETDALAEGQSAMCRSVRRECEQILKGGLHDASAMIHADVRDFMAGLEDSALEQGGLDTAEKKLDALEGMKKYADHFVDEATTLGLDFLSRVQKAKGMNWSRESTERWKRKLKEIRGTDQWPQARERLTAFMNQTLPKLEQEWKILDADLKEARTLQASLSITAKDCPELRMLDSQAFIDGKFPMRRKSVNDALRAMRAYEAFTGATETLLMAATREPGASLHPSKVHPWLTKIFKGRSLAEAKAYVANTLKSHLHDWAAVRADFDAAQKELETAGAPKTLRRLDADAFLSLSYAARLAHVAMLRSRLDTARANDAALRLAHATIRKEVDMEAWAEAEILLKDARSRFPDDVELRATAAFVQTHIADKAQEAHDPQPERDPVDVLRGMHERLRSLPPAVRPLYEQALLEDRDPASDGAHFRCVKAVMDNTLQLRKRGVLTPENEDQETRRSEELPASITPAASTPSPVEDDPVEQGVGDHNTLHKTTPDDEHTPGASVLFVRGNPDAQRTAFSAIAAGRNNADFLQNVALRPSIPPEMHTELVRTVNNTLSEDARTLREGGVSFSLETTQESLKKEKKDES